jgi:hypothetical protein
MQVGMSAFASLWVFGLLLSRKKESPSTSSSGAESKVATTKGQSKTGSGSIESSDDDFHQYQKCKNFRCRTYLPIE